MLKNYFKIAVRSLWRYKGYATLNIAGLSLGMVAAFMILLWVKDELSFDRFHRDSERIYQVMNNMKFGGNEVTTWEGSPEPLYRALASDLPEVEAAVACNQWDLTLVAEDQVFKASAMVASSGFFNFFSFPLLAGEATTVLDAPDGIVLSRPLAEKLYGSNWRQALGRPVTIKDLGDFTVAGISEAVPGNSTFNFDLVVPIEGVARTIPDIHHWGNYYFKTFVRLQPQADASTLEAKVFDTFGRNTDQGPPQGLFLHPLEKLHLYSNFQSGKVAGGRIQYVQLFSMAALFILIIACINYMNLATARASRRSHEIGIRKVVGATRRTLFQQFMSESVLLALLGALIALAVGQILLPAFNSITGKTLAIHFSNPALWVGLGTLVLVTGLLAGSYPALALSSFRIVNILQGKITQGFKDINLRRGLVVLQFGLSILLIVGALVVRQQISYIRTKNLGLDRDNVVMVPLSDKAAAHFATLREAFGQVPGVQEITAVDENPLAINAGTGDPTWDGFTEDQRTVFRVINVDYDFPNMMRIPVIAGEGFTEVMARDTTLRRYLVNEAAARAMGFDDPTGKHLKFWGDNGMVVGMVRDFHLASLHETIVPLILRLDPSRTSRLLLRPAPERTAEVIAGLRAAFEKLEPGELFEYEFLDKSFENMYSAEMTTGRLANLFALVAMLISCLGLLGLAAFTAELRTKEIGVRKVLGASVVDILLLLNREFGRLLLLAFVLAVPAAWYFTRQWLERFAYHTELSWGAFALAGALMVAVAILTVSFHSLRAATADPAESLRNE